MPDVEDGGKAASNEGGSPDKAANSPEASGPHDGQGKKRRRRRGRRNRGKKAANSTEVVNSSENANASEDKAQASREQRAEDAAGPGSKSSDQKKAGQSGRRRRGPGARAGAQASSKAGGGKGRHAHTYAALDLGTNNCRLLVARPHKGGFRIIDAFSRTVRLGAGLRSSEDGAGTLTVEAMDRSIEALKVCSQKMKRRGVTRALCIATEACRTASNGASFIARAEKETGLTLEVITPEKEAVLAVNGCAPLLDTNCDAAMVFDIGGGSTELVWLDLKPMRETGGEPKIVAWTSLPFGVVTLAETYSEREPQTQAEGLALFDEMVLRVRTEIDNFVEADHQREIYDTTRAHLIGNSGTVTTLAAVHLGLKSYDRNKVDGLWIKGQSLYDLVGRLSEMGIDERADIPSVGEDRADLLFPGCAILRAIQETWPSDRVRVADRGLREGILVELMETADREVKNNRRTRRGRRGGRRGPKSQNTQNNQNKKEPAKSGEDSNQST